MTAAAACLASPISVGLALEFTPEQCGSAQTSPEFARLYFGAFTSGAIVNSIQGD